MAGKSTSCDRIEAFSYLKAAGAGDLAAQRALALEACRASFDEGVDPVGTLVEGLVFARLAATHGHERDIGALISMLGLCALWSDDDGNKDAALAEALATLSIAADAGFEVADENFEAMVERAPPEVVALAQGLRRRMEGK